MRQLKVLASVLVCALYITTSGHAEPIEPPQQTNPGSVPANTPSPEPIDDRVRVHLDKAKLKYSTAEDGSFDVFAPTTAGRSQHCFIHSRTDMFNQAPGMTFRRILSPAIFVNEALPAPLMNSLLQESATMKVGHWGVIKNENDQYMLFCMATIAADADYETLLFTAGMVAALADAKERELTNQDKH